MASSVAKLSRKNACGTARADPWRLSARMDTPIVLACIRCLPYVGSLYKACPKQSSCNVFSEMPVTVDPARVMISALLDYERFVRSACGVVYIYST